MYTIPRFGTLDSASEIGLQLEGVVLHTLKAGDTIHARTRNHDYEISLLDPESGRALVRGGKYFAEPTEAVVSGSTIGSGQIIEGWLGVGLRMEIHAEGQYLVTTPVESLRVEQVSAEPEHTSRDLPATVSAAGALLKERAAADLVQTVGAHFRQFQARQLHFRRRAPD
jgi:hypothetical protein